MLTALCCIVFNRIYNLQNTYYRAKVPSLGRADRTHCTYPMYPWYILTIVTKYANNQTCNKKRAFFSNDNIINEMKRVTYGNRNWRKSRKIHNSYQCTQDICVWCMHVRHKHRRRLVLDPCSLIIKLVCQVWRMMKRKYPKLIRTCRHSERVKGSPYKRAIDRRPCLLHWIRVNRKRAGVLTERAGVSLAMNDWRPSPTDTLPHWVVSGYLRTHSHKNMGRVDSFFYFLAC